MMDKLILTFDIDWASEKIVDHTLQILADYGLKATFFCTHPLKSDLKGHEIAIHPDFRHLKNWLDVKEIKGIIDDLLVCYPGAKGSRSHGLITGSSIFLALAESGIKYDSSFYMFNQKFVPFEVTENLVEMPIYFLDYSMFGNLKKGSLDNLNLEKDGLKIFAFHPIHIFLNSHSLEHYWRARPYLKDQRKLSDLENKKFYGSRDFLLDLLNLAKKEKIEIQTCWEAYNSFYFGGYSNS